MTAPTTARPAPTVPPALRAALTTRQRPTPAGPLSASLTHGWRALLKIKHVPEQLFDVTMFPVMLTLLFTYLFGGALAGSPKEYIQFFLTDVQVSVAGDTALVSCTENILSGGPAPDGGDELGPLVGQLVVATNVFRRTADGWKLWSHHASPVLAESGEEEDEDTAG